MKRALLAAVGAASVVLAGCSSGGEDTAVTSVKTVTESVTAAPTTTTRDLQTDLTGAEALYLSNVQPLTPSLTDSERVDYGYSTCQRLDEGKSLNAAVIALQVNYQVPREEAAYVAMSAPLNLCVEHKARASAEMRDLAGG